MLHGGKGICLDIHLIEAEFEYYLIFYRASLPTPINRELQLLLEQQDPFHVQYVLVPHHPIVLYQLIERMNQIWAKPGALGKFQVKALFYQFVHELMSQLAAQGIPLAKPDLVAQAMRYLNEQYANHTRLEELARLFDCSSGHLSRSEIEQTEIWKSLKAVKNNHVHLVDYTIWFQGPGAPIGQSKLLEEAVNLLTK